MKRAILLILCLVVPILISCAYNPNDVVSVKDKAQDDTIKTLTTQVASIQGLLDAKATKDYVDAKIAGLASTNSYTKAEVDKMITDTKAAAQASLDSAITALKSDQSWVKNTTVNQQPQQNPTAPAGVVSYVIQYIPQGGYWQFTSQQVVTVRVTNNKPDTRYVRLRITLNTFPNSTLANLSSLPTATQVSNSQGQAAPIFVATPIPSGLSNIVQVLFYPTSGGVSNGQYLVGSGSYMDVTVQISTPGYSGLWTVAVSGDDTNLSGY